MAFRIKDPPFNQTTEKKSSLFGAKTFHRSQIERSLPKELASNWIAAMEGKDRINPEYLDCFAEALKEWALAQGATHYTHWFQPLTGSSAEKHDAFLSWGPSFQVLEVLKGKELLQGEPDASSFPSGGLRSTPAARGYTIWDPSTPAFLWESTEGLTLCLPSLFFSWTGESLDYKTPLLRSNQKINTAVRRLLKFAGLTEEQAYATLGPEQEYFTIDQKFVSQRPDLLLAGRTVFGARPPKGQELEDHYFSTIHERVLSFMIDFEAAALQLGIPVKTRHNEVAPSQHEIAPLFEKAALASDHNLLLMELMRQKARHHHLACLFHEKPFAYCNGSGKHCNWSLATESGVNLLNPSEDSFVFITLLTAILRGVHEHAALLRCSIASASNDWRLGGSEAPPTILSVYLGSKLESLVQKIIHEQKPSVELRNEIDLGLLHIPAHIPEESDRNRTSFFAFTGNKFEFRAVGASQHVAWPITIINSIVANSLNLLLDELESTCKTSPLSSPHTSKDLLLLALPMLRNHLKSAEPVLFSGDNYSQSWEEEAKQRGLPNTRKSFHAFYVLTEAKTKKIFEDILSDRELHARFEIFIEKYAKEMNIECNLMSDLFQTYIFPAALSYQKEWAETISVLSKLQINHSQDQLKRFSEKLQKASRLIEELDLIKAQTSSLGWEAKAKVFCELALPLMEQTRFAVDELELIVPNHLWPLPKIRDMLFTK